MSLWGDVFDVFGGFVGTSLCGPFGAFSVIICSCFYYWWLG